MEQGAGDLSASGRERATILILIDEDGDAFDFRISGSEAYRDLLRDPARVAFGAVSRRLDLQRRKAS